MNLRVNNTDATLVKQVGGKWAQVRIDHENGNSQTHWVRLDSCDLISEPFDFAPLPAAKE